MTQGPMTPEEIDEAIQKLRFPKPKLSADEAVAIALEQFLDRPEANHCAPSTIIALQQAYDLPAGDMLPWIAAGFRGGVCVGEICGALSGGVMAMGLMAYKVLEPKTPSQQKIACMAVTPYVRDLIYYFNRMFGSVHCAILSGQSEKTPEEIEIEIRNRIVKDICKNYVAFVVKTMVNWGEISQEPPKRVPFGAPPLKLG